MSKRTLKPDDAPIFNISDALYSDTVSYIFNLKSFSPVEKGQLESMFGAVGINNMFVFDIDFFYEIYTLKKYNFSALSDILLINAGKSNTYKNIQIIINHVLFSFFSNPIKIVAIDKPFMNKVVSGETIYPLISAPESKHYSPITDKLHELLKVSLGAGDLFIKNYVKYLGYKRNEIAVSPYLKKWFGCYAPLPSFSLNIQQECDPLCVYQEAIKLYEVPELNDVIIQEKECNGALCIIDNVSVAGSGVHLTINQICPQCITAGASCRCVVDITVPGVLDKIGFGEPTGGSFGQYCPNAECIQFDPITQIADIVECNQGISTQTFGDNFVPKEVGTTQDVLVIFFIFIIFVLFIFGANYIIVHHKAKVPVL